MARRTDSSFLALFPIPLRARGRGRGEREGGREAFGFLVTIPACHCRVSSSLCAYCRPRLAQEPIPEIGRRNRYTLGDLSSTRPGMEVFLLGSRLPFSTNTLFRECWQLCYKYTHWSLSPFFSPLPFNLIRTFLSLFLSVARNYFAPRFELIWTKKGDFCSSSILFSDPPRRDIFRDIRIFFRVVWRGKEAIEVEDQVKFWEQAKMYVSCFVTKITNASVLRISEKQ